VVDVDAHGALELSAAAIRSQAMQSRRAMPIQRSANAFACGARNGGVPTGACSCVI
jgi:hypothetical protein